jgi:hypothetical protein
VVCRTALVMVASTWGGPAPCPGAVTAVDDLAGPWSVTVTGLHVWRYLGGPWEHVETVPLSG